MKNSILVLYRCVSRFLKQEDGPTAVEYAVILALILLALLSSAQFFGGVTGGSLIDSDTKIGEAMNGGS